MSTVTEKKRLLSHTLSPTAVSQLIQEKIASVTARGPQPHVSVQQQIDIIHQLGEFELGRYLLQNQGLNGYWTHFLLTYPWTKNKIQCTPFEKQILERAPLILATQERFQIFLSENQRAVHPEKKLACIPCGMMGELLYLDFAGIDTIELIGIDYDATIFEHAKNLATEKNLLPFSTFCQSDAWDLQVENEFDLISSNGLNIYEPRQEKITALYQRFYRALKPGGKLVTSFITPPPGTSEHSEWNMQCIDPQDLLLEKILLVDILEAKWQCFSSTQQMKMLLESVGFKKIHVIPDKANIFPTITGIKE